MTYEASICLERKNRNPDAESALVGDSKHDGNGVQKCGNVSFKDPKIDSPLGHALLTVRIYTVYTRIYSI